jgi:hypothetical protein
VRWFCHHYRFPGPEVKRQFELFRVMINDRLGNLSTLPRQELASLRPDFPFRFERFWAVKTIRFNPDTDGLRRNSKELGNFLLLFPVH